jgi:hypothetical protein
VSSGLFDLPTLANAIPSSITPWPPLRPCGPQWQVILIHLVFFLANFVLISISVVSAMGEQARWRGGSRNCTFTPAYPSYSFSLSLSQILSDSINFSDIIGLLVMHLQYLIVVLRIQMRWPNEVANLTRTVSTITNFAASASTLGCLSSTGEGSSVWAAVREGSSLGSLPDS